MGLALTAGPRARYARSKPLRAAGFTLLEIMIAVSILAIIVLVLYGSFSTVVNSVERVDEDQVQLRIADFLVSHFEQNISGAYLAPFGVAAQGVEFIGEDAEETDGRQVDTLTFYTTAARMGGGALPGDTKQVAYALIEGDDGRHMFTVYEKPRLLLPMRDDSGGDWSGQPQWTVPMASLDFQYYDGSEWLYEWNSGRMGRLPRAVKIEVHFFGEEFEWFVDRLGMPKPVLVMVVSIPLGYSESAEKA
jgi:type II secretion system protein J